MYENCNKELVCKYRTEFSFRSIKLLNYKQILHLCKSPMGYWNVMHNAWPSPALWESGSLSPKSSIIVDNQNLPKISIAPRRRNGFCKSHYPHDRIPWCVLEFSICFPSDILDIFYLLWFENKKISLRRFEYLIYVLILKEKETAVSLVMKAPQPTLE